MNRYAETPSKAAVMAEASKTARYCAAPESKYFVRYAPTSPMMTNHAKMIPPGPWKDIVLHVGVLWEYGHCRSCSHCDERRQGDDDEVGNDDAHPVLTKVVPVVVPLSWRGLRPEAERL
ncbi:hypothetical protein SNQ42_03475 [Cutibacterium avidum]|uniref:hypothetical protein n=1 Tax=Cutibacterium avidum TaxID=33010 RepID=UPI002A5A9BF9|nr:hypothetical protein [Cutibacterium avidum]MDY0730570.1 hypothetical protein [Cutibacterium avidum]